MLTRPINPPRTPETSAVDLPAPDFLQRRQLALAAARRANHRAAALVLCDPADIHYLTGTRHGISWMVVADGAAFAVSRHMLVSEVRAEAVDCDILLASASSTERPELEQFVVGELAKRGLDSVIVDPARTSAQSYRRLSRHTADCGISLLDLPEALAGVGALKDPCELALTQQCVTIAERELSELLAQELGRAHV